MNTAYIAVLLAAFLGAFGWLLNYLVRSVTDRLDRVGDSLDANTAALTKFKEEAHETFARKDDYRLKWVERAFHRRADDETNPGAHFDSLG